MSVYIPIALMALVNAVAYVANAINEHKWQSAAIAISYGVLAGFCIGMAVDL